MFARLQVEYVWSFLLGGSTMTRGISLTVCTLVWSAFGATIFGPGGRIASAVDRPTAEQIAEMKAAGVYEQRLERANTLGNNRFSLAMTQRALRKIRMSAVVARRGPVGETGLGAFVGPAFAFPYTKPSELKSLGTVRTLTVLVDFADRRAETELPGMTPDVFAQNIYASGTAAAQNFAPFESLHAYYQRASQGKVDVQGNVLGWYHFAKNRADYAPTSSDAYAHNKAIFDMLAEVLGSFDPQHDFAQRNEIELARPGWLDLESRHEVLDW